MDAPSWKPTSRAEKPLEAMAGATSAAAAPHKPAPEDDAGGADARSDPAPTSDAGKNATPDPAAVSGGAGASAEAGSGGSQAPAAPSAAGAQAAGGAPQPPLPAAACQPGAYTGAFTGSIQLIGLSLTSVTGTIRAQLELDASNETLTLRDTRIQGVDQDGNRVTGVLTGKLDCRTRELEDGRLENGNHRNKDDKGKGTAFSGTTKATYASDPPSVTGTWQAVADDVAVLAGQGTWSLVFTGNGKN